MRIALIACASRIDLEAEGRAVGEWFLELAYEDIDRETAESLRSSLAHLGQAAPSLWRYMSKADAALADVL
jgi:hypothetical protein